MKIFTVLLALILALPFALAQLPEVDITPPSLPSEDKIQLTLELFDFISKNLVSNIHARLALKSEDDEINTLKYVPENGKLKLNLEPGKWNIKILIDDINTPGKDYIYETNLYLTKPKSEKFYLFPSGSVQGTVLLKEDAVPLADVLLYCSGTEEVKEAATDLTGSFSFDWIPVGECRIVSVFQSKRGESNVQVIKGGLSKANIELTGGVVQAFEIWVYLIIFFVFALVIALLIILFARRKKPVKIEVKEEKSVSRIDDILKTLSFKEKAVVNFLLENNAHSTQAAIKNQTNIPKTTLIRLFQSLEAKNIIIIERVGKMKKIALSDWFLNK